MSPSFFEHRSDVSLVAKELYTESAEVTKMTMKRQPFQSDFSNNGNKYTNH